MVSTDKRARQVQGRVVSDKMDKTITVDRRASGEASGLRQIHYSIIKVTCPR